MNDKPMSEKRKLQLAHAVSVYDIHDRAMLRMAEWGRTNRYPTGWAQFDKYLYGGFGLHSDGELVVVAGETKIGKSTFVANVAMRIAQNDTKVCYIPLENGYEQTYGMLCKAGGTDCLIDYKDLIYFPDEDLIFGDEAWNADDLLAHMEHMVMAWGINVFVLDHLNFMFENEQHVRDELMRVRVVMRKLSRFCVRHKATVLAISHMNKAQRGGIKPDKLTIDRIYGSYAIAGAATKVLLLQRLQPELIAGGIERQRVELFFAASRHTRGRDTGFLFDTTETKWDEIGENTL
jgi:predicted ATP-dependent serine protease